MKKDTRRDLGKRLVNREAEKWLEGGWLEESSTRWIWTRDGMRLVTITDYLGRYDRIFVWPARGVTVYVQVSRKYPGSHPGDGPLGFPHPHDLTPDWFLDAPKKGKPLSPGSYEVYVVYRHLKGHGNMWIPDRRWWEAKALDIPPILGIK